jgi:hypothetical protein
VTAIAAFILLFDPYEFFIKIPVDPVHVAIVAFPAKAMICICIMKYILFAYGKLVQFVQKVVIHQKCARVSTGCLSSGIARKESIVTKN